MTYPYGTKGAPVVGNGLGGLPRRAAAASPSTATPDSYKAVIFTGAADPQNIDNLTDGLHVSFGSVSLKLNYDGQIVWQKSTPPGVQRVIQDGSDIYALMGDYYIRKYDDTFTNYSASVRPSSTTNTIDLAVTSDAIYTVGASGSVSYVHKLPKDLSSNLWTRQIAASFTCTFRVIIATSDGGCLVGGFTNNDSGGGTVYGKACVIKFDSSGTQQWSITYPSASNRYSFIGGLVEGPDAYFARMGYDTGGGWDQLRIIAKDGSSSLGCDIGTGTQDWSYSANLTNSVAINNGVVAVTNAQSTTSSGTSANIAFASKGNGSATYNTRTLFQINSLFPFNVTAFGCKGVVPYRRSFAMTGKLVKQYDTSYDAKAYVLFADYAQNFAANLSDGENISNPSAANLIAKKVLVSSSAGFTPTTFSTQHTVSNLSLSVVSGGSGSNTNAATYSVQEVLTQ